MLDQVLDAFHVTPDYDLAIMKDKQTLFDITSNILNGIGEVLDEVQPDVVLVHGDTSTTFVTALACFYKQIPVGHVEAGLRTYNIYSPYPEEFNRQAVGIIAKYNFAPTELSKNNLLKEGKTPDSIFITGNTAIDALKTTVREDYTPHLADPIKWGAFRRDNQEFVEEHFGEYVRLWLRLGVRYPTVYLKAWVELTRGYWDSGYRFWIYAQGVIENEFGIAHTGELSAVASAFRGYFTAFEGSRFCQPLCAIGLHVWLLIGCTIVNALKKRREEAVLAVPILVLVVGLWLGTPVYAEFRYAYPFFVTIPLLLGATCFQQEKRKGQNA